MSSPPPLKAMDVPLVIVGRGKSAVDKLLADIPGLSVGLLGFAALTFFMILKKVKLATFILLSSALFAFFAAIVDLARISLRHDNSGRLRTDNDGITDSLVTAREVLTSVSFGLRFLYFWAFVSQPPLCEQGSGSFLRMHSGSWLHWGLTGTVLRWSTLLASLSIFVLQLVWRIARLRGGFGPVYSVESSLEIAASAIYMIKLFLNSTIVEADCRRETLWQYSTALLALFINLGVGLGNILDLRFSETALVSSMIFSFYSREPPAIPMPKLRNKRASSFRGLHVSFYDAGLGLVGDIPNPRRSSRSPFPRSSSWLSWNAPQRRSSQSRPSDEEVERGLTSSTTEKGAPSALDDIQPPSVNSSITDAIRRGISEGFSSPTVQLPADARLMTASPDSPTLGPDGIKEAQQGNRPSRRPEPEQPSDGSLTSSQGSGFEKLLREQNELERSIAELRSMFARGQSGKELKVKSPDAVSDSPGRGKRRESSTTTANGLTSASGRSDFSLSVFPEPPQLPRDTELPRKFLPQFSSESALAPTRRSFTIEEQGFPVSTTEGDGVAISAFGRRTESAGTHYDVTSFIGDLTSPGRVSAAQIAMYYKNSDSEGSVTSSADLATIVTVERKPSNGVISRPTLVEKTTLATNSSPADRSIPPGSRRSAIPSQAAVTNIPTRQRSPTTSDRRTLTMFTRTP
ncbi:hypothetical protein F5148DRAFT_1192760, partial [Russula earlei]